jgi:SAM-dependent methyltransferase
LNSSTIHPATRAHDSAQPDPARRDSHADAAAPADRHVDRFFALLDDSLADDAFVKVILARHHGSEPQLNQVLVRRLDVRGVPQLSFTYRYQTRDVTKNLPVAEGVRTIRELLGPSFRNGHLLTPTQELQLAFSKKDKATLRIGQRAGAESASSGDDASTDDATPAEDTGPQHPHDRQKVRPLDLDRPFLQALGVTDASHRLIPAMSRKWKQINRFVEVFSSALAASPLVDAKAVHVADFGSGKGYLTFAIHDYLDHGLGKDAQVTGVELRQDMVSLCSAAAERLGLEGLRFAQGDVQHYTPAQLDVMIALHACDVATDYAIHMGIRSGASIIMCSPCCHKQIRPQLLSPHPLRPILQHGVHLGQEAEMVTDGLRALLLEACGYRTQVFEFISLEHTNKNKMILAVKSAHPAQRPEVLAQIQEIKTFYGIREQCLETLLKEHFENTIEA